jgi:cytochrome P450
MSNYDSVDFFTDASLVPDPHPYFDYLRSKNPVLRLPHQNVVAVTGYDEATAVYKDPDTFSNCVALGGHSRRCHSSPRARNLTTSRP